MQRACLGVVGLLVALALTGAAAAQTVDNPQYQLWAAWREGTSFTMTSESVFEGMRSMSTQTTTLKKVSAEKVVIEVSSITEVAGQRIKMDPVTTDIPAKYPRPKIDSKDAPKPTEEKAPKYKETKGRETLTISGKKLSCEWTQIGDEGGAVTKTWQCDDVPFRLVKMVSSYKGGTSTMTLTEWKGTKK